MNALGSAYLATVIRLTAKDLDHIERALAFVDEEQVWTRPNPATNSLGNLLYHLAASHRFWIVSVVGRQPTTRERHLEFEATGGRTKAELVAALRLSIADASDVLAGLEPDTLLDTREAFGRQLTVLEAIQHTAVHVSLHTGQILYIVKALTGRDLSLPR
jgi:uncharacterized damage-inducible protein DinB